MASIPDVLHPRVRRNKTTRLQQALRHDDVTEAQRSLSLGTYPHALFHKALRFNAWKTVEFLLHHHTSQLRLTALQWRNILEYPVEVPTTIAYNALINLPRQGSMGMATLVAWERSLKLQFKIEDYRAQWVGRTDSWFVRNAMHALARLHRFDVVDCWLQHVESDKLPAWFNQAWTMAVHSDNLNLWKWLAAKEPKIRQVPAITQSVWKSRVSMMIRFRGQDTQGSYSFDDVLTRWATIWDMPMEWILGSIAVLDNASRRPLLPLIQESNLVPATWKEFFASENFTKCADNTLQSRVALVWSIAATQEERLTAFLTDEPPVELTVE